MFGKMKFDFITSFIQIFTIKTIIYLLQYKKLQVLNFELRPVLKFGTFGTARKVW